MSGGMRMSAGRKREPIWCRYEELPNKKVKCKECNKSFSSNADRVRAHSTLHDRRANVAQAVEAWKVLLEKLRGNTEFRDWLEKCEARYNVSVLFCLKSKFHVFFGALVVRQRCRKIARQLLLKVYCIVHGEMIPTWRKIDRYFIYPLDHDLVFAISNDWILGELRLLSDVDSWEKLE